MKILSTLFIFILTSKYCIPLKINDSIEKEKQNLIRAHLMKEDEAVGTYDEFSGMFDFDHLDSILRGDNKFNSGNIEMHDYSLHDL